ncbi:hypothetical protein JMJ77_0008607 [Colletotrichum scovillei]|uniref:Uncharacterized protein n=1 Tax=Colletotrichum scovillei TaxID=1209932 RepID=A0A9P7RGV9_9PEZI|nr:hypothetical protein JMJ77_0008607 [Colletotrichum scovillei]KAG7075599.1 hypothetical protein JMJ76_0012058 [Colletotrichum scovillei]KAG7082712.1 hypothetical protein JMJ78_0004812 [Colletotrichum scovillei]
MRRSRQQYAAGSIHLIFPFREYHETLKEMPALYVSSLRRLRLISVTPARTLAIVLTGVFTSAH